jgi:hypothetical protein
MGPMLLLAAVVAPTGLRPAEVHEVRLCRTVRDGPSPAVKAWPPASACCEAARNSSGTLWCCSTPGMARTEPTLLCLGMEPGDGGEAWISRDLGAGGVMKLLARHTTGPPSAGLPPPSFRARLEQTLSDGPACTDAGCSAFHHVTEELNATVATSPPRPADVSPATPADALGITPPQAYGASKIKISVEGAAANSGTAQGPRAVETPPPPVRAPRKLTASSFARR